MCHLFICTANGYIESKISNGANNKFKIFEEWLESNKVKLPKLELQVIIVYTLIFV